MEQWGYSGSTPDIPLWLATVTAYHDMSDNHETEYADDALLMDGSTDAQEIQEFVLQRARSPYTDENITVWNFNNHTVDTETLGEQSDSFRQDEFVIPFQASGVWGYMTQLLPDRLREAEILAYRRTEKTYHPYKNYFRVSDDEVNEKLRESITDFLDREGI